MSSPFLALLFIQVPALLAKDVISAGGRIMVGAPVFRIEQIRRRRPEVDEQLDPRKEEGGVLVYTQTGRALGAKAVILAMPPHLTGKRGTESREGP